jgi:hypothetical protein
MTVAYHVINQINSNVISITRIKHKASCVGIHICTNNNIVTWFYIVFVDEHRYTSLSKLTVSYI